MTKEELLQQLENADSNDRELFKKLIAGALENGLSNKEVAHMFGIAFSTVDRWLAGETAPATAMRGVVYRTLKEKVEQLQS